MNIASQNLLNQSLSTAKAKLKTFADRADFIAQLKIAFGEDFNPSTALGIASSIKSDDYSFLPSIEIRTSTELAGGNGAYDAANNRIFVSSDFIAQNAGNPSLIVNLLLEEIGQKFDTILNGTKDSAGDEGAIFSTISQGKTISASDLAALKAEDDSQTLNIDGKQVAVEMQNFIATTGVPNITGSANDDVITGNGIDNTLIGLAGNDTIYGSGGNDNIQGGDDNDILYGDSAGSNVAVAAADVNVFTGYNGAGAVNLASKILSENSGLTIVSGTATYTGANVATATFNSIDLGTVSNTAANGTVNSTSYALGGGILLTTGKAAVPLTNTKASTTTDVTTSFSNANSGAGDSQINQVITSAFGAAGSTQDASVLKFDFTTVPGATEVSLDVMFGSEEFPEFSNTAYVDIAAVFVDGINYALFNNNPAQPLSILDINQIAGNLTNNLDSKLKIEYDAISSPLRVVATLDPTKTTHTIKIAIADTGDQRLDSGIFVSNFKINNQSSQFSSLGLLNDDNLQGGAGNDTIYGELGNDSIDGGAGVDTMVGSVGNDTYVVDNSGDVVTELATEGTDTVSASLNYTLTPNVENLTLTGTDNINGTGNTLNNVIVGNIGNNILDGDTGADTMSGAAGNDTYIVDNPGDVVIEKANQGNDTVNASINYSLTAEVENLTLTGTAGITGTGNNLNNIITGNSGINTLIGGVGNDTLNGGGGNDTLNGGVGDDTYIVDNIGVVTTEAANEGTDTVKSSLNTYTLAANLENLTLTGTGLNGTGNSSDNVITGNSGNNALNGISGTDTLIGGAGNDIYTINNSDSIITELSAQGTDDVYTNVSYTLGNDVSVETMYLSGYNLASSVNGGGNNLDNTIIDFGGGSNTLVGGDNTLSGGGGNDKLEGRGGNDTLDGGTGNDNLIGGTGNDTYIVDSTGDVVTELANEGTDTVNAGATYTLAANLENLTLTGTGNIDGIGNSANNVITGNSGNNALNGISGIDTLIGGAGNDIYTINNSDSIITELSAQGTDDVYTNVSYTLGTDVSVETMYLSGYGSAVVNGGGNNLDNTIIDNGGGDNILSGGGGNDNLQGGGGNDTLDGGTGNDTLIGGTGNDTYTVDITNDVVTELANEGTDTVNAGATYTLATNLENLNLTGTANIDGTGNSGINVITGNSGNNTLNGGGGTDTLSGGAGDDTYIINNTGVVVNEAANAGTDTVNAGITYTLGANLENLTLTGTDAINGTGNALNNLIIGNSANNTLTGDAGNDEYKFGAGTLASTASVTTVFGSDTITDFKSAEDRLSLSNATFTAVTADANGFITNFATVATDALAETSAAAIVYSQASGKLFYNANGATLGLGTAGGNFATLSSKPAITSQDIKVYDIIGNNGPIPVITLAVSPLTGVSEDGAANLAYTFTRTGNTASALTVNYGIAGTAANGTDYTSIGTSVTFLANESTAIVTIDPTVDTIAEETETVALTLVNGSGYTVGTTTAVTGNILDDDALITLAVAPASVFEDGMPNLEYTFTRTGPTTNALTVNYTIASGGDNATNGTDYETIGTSVTFAANSATASVTVNPKTDTTIEKDETVALTLASGTNYKVGTTTAVVGTIVNDEVQVTLSLAPTSVVEDGMPNLEYTFTRTGPTTNALIVNYTISGDATNGTDYDPIGTSVTFAAGSPTATVTVNPKTDTTVENNETVGLKLATGSGYTIGTTDTITGTIVDDDAPAITIAVAPGIVDEDGIANLIYTFTRSVVTSSSLTVNYTIATGGDNATNGTDYDTIGTSVTFAAGSPTATVIVNPKTDTTVEKDETVKLTLASATGSNKYTIGAVKDATGTIKNDDTKVSIGSSGGSVFEDGGTNLVYTFTRTGNTASDLTVNYTVGGAVASDDYVVKIGNPLVATTTRAVTFAANSSTATVTIDPTADTVVEGDEAVTLTLATGTGYTIESATGTGTIKNDDTEVTITGVSPSTVTETDTPNMEYTFTRTGLITNALTVNYTISGTATNGTDYDSIVNSVTFAANSATAKVIVNPTPDSNTTEGNETVTLTLASATGNNKYTIGAAKSSATGTITDVATGTISGIKWNDLNGNGVREELIQGTAPDVVFVIDKSGSTEAQFQGLAVGDVNNDGLSNTRLDAELQAVIKLNDRLVTKFGNTAKISIIAFDANAPQIDMNTTLSGVQLFTTAAADSNNNGTKDVEEILKGIKLASVPGTNFESGLEKAVTAFSTLLPSATNRNLIFISDGVNTRGGAYTDEVQTLKNSGVLLSSFGVGADASLADLQAINPNASVFKSTDELFAVFDGLGSGTQNFKEPTLSGVRIYLDRNNNGALDAGEENQLTSGAGQYSFANIAPGDYFVREVVPAGFTQTTPVIKTTVVASQTATANFGNIALPTISLAVSPASVNEDGTANLIYTFTRTGNLTSAQTVNYTVGGTGTFNTDYTQSGAASFTATTGSITFGANLSTATLTINPATDTTVEPDETVALTLVTGSGYTLGTPNAVVGTILNDEVEVTLAVSAPVLENGADNLVYTFTRTGSTTNPLTVNYTVGGTATAADADYTLTGGAGTGANRTVTFAANAATATVTINPTEDTTVEPDETVSFTLASGTGYTVGTTGAVATGTITNDDATVTLLATNATVDEDGAANIVYTFTRTGSTTSALTVSYELGGTAANDDYAVIGGASGTGNTRTVTFEAGKDKATIAINPTADNIVESNETVTFKLLTGSGYNVGTTAPVEATITDDDANVTFAVNRLIVTEAGADNLVYTFTRAGNTKSALTVNYELGGTAMNGEDYAVLGGIGTGNTRSVTFAPDATTATITIDPTADNIIEGDETVTFKLLGGNGYSFVNPTPLSASIVDTTSVTLSATTVPVSEDGAANLVYTFTRTGITTSALTVNYEIGGAATNGTDYALVGTSVTFDIGETTKTVTIDPTADNIVESTEDITFKLLAGTGYSVGTTAPVSASITDDDANITLSATLVPVTEDGAANLVYTFTRAGSTTSALTVNYEIGGTATNDDYGIIIGGVSVPNTTRTVTFAANATTATVSIDPTADNIVELTEDITFKLLAGNGYSVVDPTPVVASITDDDADVTLSATLAPVSEDGAANLVYTFTRTGSTTSALTVNYELGGTATNGTDYALVSTSVTFAAGETTANVTIDPTADSIVESTEDITFKLLAGNGYSVVTTDPVSASILDDDTSIRLEATVDLVTEEGADNLVYTFTRTGNTAAALDVSYEVGGTATNGTDYAVMGGTSGTGNTRIVTFDAGEATKTVTIDPTTDNLVEPTETVTFKLLAGSGYSVNPTTATPVVASISDDDANVTLAATVREVTEDGAGNLVYTFTRTGNTAPKLTINYVITGTATNGIDYVQTSNSVTFGARETTATVTIDPLTDDFIEQTETVAFTLAAGTGYTVGTIDPVVANILDDDNLYVVNIVNGEVTINGVVGNTVNDTNNGNDTIDLTSITTGVIIDLSVTTPQDLDTNLQLVIPVVNIENVIGSTGDDIITGNSLNNTLTGGTGNDIFIFGGNPLPNGQTVADVLGHDKITDFTRDEDKIYLNPSTFANLTFGNDGLISNLTTVEINPSTSSVGLVYNKNTGNLFYDGQKFLTFTGNPLLDNTDFLTGSISVG